VGVRRSFSRIGETAAAAARPFFLTNRVRRIRANWALTDYYYYILAVWWLAYGRSGSGGGVYTHRTR